MDAGRARGARERRRDSRAKLEQDDRTDRSEGAASGGAARGRDDVAVRQGAGGESATSPSPSHAAGEYATWHLGTLDSSSEPRALTLTESVESSRRLSRSLSPSPPSRLLALFLTPPSPSSVKHRARETHRRRSVRRVTASARESDRRRHRRPRRRQLSVHRDNRVPRLSDANRGRGSGKVGVIPGEEPLA